MKKLINNPRNLVREVLEGLADTTPGLAILDTENVILRIDSLTPAERPVVVISGGGSGHEPGHAGYVGRGMLGAAIAGDVFTSPSVDSILAGIKASAGPRGAVLVVKNYTGDRLNFGLAAELASAAGIPTQTVIVADDVALRDTVPPDRRRGIAGTIFVHKIAGAAAEAGNLLADVAAIARTVATQVGTMGVALGSCTVPSVGKPGFSLGEDEIELGLGIHGEQGVKRLPMESADSLVERMLDTIILDRALTPGTRVAILVNGLGATPPIELSVVARHAIAYARARGLVVERLYSGSYLTALDMPGCSLSLLPVDDALLAGLDAPTDARGWISDGRVPSARTIIAAPRTTPDQAAAIAGPQTASMRAAAMAVADALIAAEAELADLDGRAGDGDLGASMARAAEALKALPDAAFNTPASTMMAMSDALRRAIGGSSGPFYAVALARASKVLNGLTNANSAQWLSALMAATSAISDLGGARPGDRTMIDALHPAAQGWQDALKIGADGGAAFRAGVDAATAGAAATSTMAPRLGRASYLGDRANGIPDGGAAAVTIWLEAIAGTLKV